MHCALTLQWCSLVSHHYTIAIMPPVSSPWTDPGIPCRAVQSSQAYGSSPGGAFGRHRQLRRRADPERLARGHGEQRRLHLGAGSHVRDQAAHMAAVSAGLRGLPQGSCMLSLRGYKCMPFAEWPLGVPLLCIRDSRLFVVQLFLYRIVHIFHRAGYCGSSPKLAV